MLYCSHDVTGKVQAIFKRVTHVEIALDHTV